MTETIKNWAIIALCLQVVVVLAGMSMPETYGEWMAARDIAYDRVWSDYISEVNQ